VIMGLSAAEDSARTDARMLDRAEGVLLALRRCTINEAFEEIVAASKRHRVPTLTMARALVALVENAGAANDTNAAAAARYEWGALLEVR
jgi:ANTAR domain